MLAELLDGTRIIVCLGAGGVGKTTTAASLATAAAMAGDRVAVLTIDPAARLKDALDLPEEPGRLHRVPLPGEPTGSLDAILLDAKGLFDDLVRRLSGGAALAEAIVENPVYRNIAGAFAGSDSYMALEQLLDIADDERFDLIVVDTPPATHALELFDAPDRILALLESRALDYLSEPLRILGAATSRFTRGILSGVLAALERMTGLSLMSDISQLAADFSAIAPAFRERAHAIRELLHGEETRFVLVTAPEPHLTREVVAFAHEIDDAGIPIDAVIINRLFDPAEMAMEPSALVAQSSKDEGKAAAPWSAALARKLVQCLREIEARQVRQEHLVSELRGALDEVGTHSEARLWGYLPARHPAPTTLAGIARLAEALAPPPPAE